MFLPQELSYNWVRSVDKFLVFFRLYDCDPGKPVGCNWLGRRWQILNHVHEVHKTTLVLKESNYCKIKDFFLYDHGLTTQVIVAHGELFWLHHKKSSSKSKFFAAVQHVGLAEDAEKYKYELRLAATNSSGMEITFSRNTHKDTEAIKNVFSSEDCLCISELAAKNFVAEDDILRFSLKVLIKE